MIQVENEEDIASLAEGQTEQSTAIGHQPPALLD